MTNLSGFALLMLLFVLPMEAAQVQPRPRLDIYGDPLPPGASARMGAGELSLSFQRADGVRPGWKKSGCFQFHDCSAVEPG